MSEADFMDLVRRMRQAQEDYKRHRIKSTLILSWDLEVQVDEYLEKQTANPKYSRPKSRRL